MTCGQETWGLPRHVTVDEYKCVCRCHIAASRSVLFVKHPKGATTMKIVIIGGTGLIGSKTVAN